MEMLLSYAQINNFSDAFNPSDKYSRNYSMVVCNSIKTKLLLLILVQILLLERNLKIFIIKFCSIMLMMEFGKDLHGSIKLVNLMN